MAETMYDRFREKNNPTNENNTEVTEVTPQENNGEQENTTGQETEVTTEATETEGQNSPEGGKTFDVGSVNDYFGSSFKDEGELRDLLGSQEKFKGYESEISNKDEELRAAHEKYNSLLDSIDPEKIFPNKEAVALSQLAEKYPKADVGILSKIRNTDLDAMNKLDALVMIDKLMIPSNYSDSVRKNAILRGLGIESEDVSELSDDDKYKIEREYVSKSNMLQEIKGFQAEVKKFDFEAEKAERQRKSEQDKQSLKSHNEKALKILLDGYKETKSVYKEDGKDRFYTYVVDDSFKSGFFNEMLDSITDSGIRITNENAQEVARQIDNEYWLQNRDKIVHDAIKQAISGQKDASHSEIHSDSPTNKTEAPPTSKKVPQTVMDQYRQGLLKRK